MSIQRCQECETNVDTDFDSDHFNEDGTCAESENLCTTCDKIDCTCDDDYEQRKDYESKD